MNDLKYTTTLLSLLLSLITLVIPLVVISNVLGGNMTLLVGLLFVTGVLLFNIYAVINGDRIANTFALIVTLFSLLLSSYSLWNTYIF